MADITQDQNGNFLNPSYVTPEQLKQARDYADQLQKGSTAPTSSSWAGVLAQALMGANAAMTTNRANQQQREVLQQNANALQGAQDPYTNAMVHGLGAPPPVQSAPMPPPQMAPQGAAPPMPPQGANPADVGGVPMPPGQNLTGPNTQISGVQYGPVTGNGSFSGSSPSGAGSDVSQALMGKPIQMAQNAPTNSAAGLLANTSLPPDVRARLIEGMAPKGGADVMGNPVVGTTMGGLHSTGVGPGVSTGVWKPQAVTTPNASVSGEQLQSTQGGAGGGFGGNANKMMDVAQGIGQRGALMGANNDQIKNDQSAAYQTIPIRQTLATMKDDILSHGDKMVWGPTADWLNNLKRGIAQHAPGLMSQEDLAGLASADSFGKLTAQLQTMVGRQIGGTDASLMQGMQSVPGAHNSKEGALALIDMLDQTAKQNAQFMIQNGYKIGQPGFDMLAAKSKFYEDNPITNPITKHPLRLDLSSKGNEPSIGGGGWGIKR